MGHVIKRHSLRQALQSTVLGVLAVTITGDISSVSSIVTTLPIILTQLGYSRDFEREADQFSLGLMREQGIDPQNFATILRRIEKTATCIKSQEVAASKEQECSAHVTEEDDELTSYLSTHPSTEERLQDFLPPSS
jgi:Zn-dependent protease with chaperone function